MSITATPDEQPKAKVARRVVAVKRKYFVPEHNVAVEATSVDDAVSKAQKLTSNDAKEGDV